MSKADTELVGATRLRVTLRAAAAGLAHLERAELGAGRLIEQRARGAAPKRSGRLAGSLTTRTGAAEVAVVSSQVYAGVIEYGWAARGIRAHPFLVPTAQALEPVWRPLYVADVNAVLDRVKGA